MWLADRQLDASIIEATSIDDTGRELSSSCPCTMQEIERHDEKKHRSTFFGDPNKQPLPGRGEESEIIGFTTPRVSKYQSRIYLHCCNIPQEREGRKKKKERKKPCCCGSRETFNYFPTVPNLLIETCRLDCTLVHPNPVKILEGELFKGIQCLNLSSHIFTVVR